MEFAIDVRDLRRAYGDLEAVRGISFRVAPGEVFCLLGPNGAGKTTTTEILEGYRARTGGDVRVLGFDPAAGERALRERVGVVLQESAVHGELTVAEVLRMHARYYPRPRPAGELIELVALDAKQDAPVKRLSGGQRRRLDLALALVGDPDHGARRAGDAARPRARRRGRRRGQPRRRGGRGGAADESGRRAARLTTFGRPGYLRRAMESGARGFLLKDAPVDELARAIRRAMAGERVVDPALAAAALSEGDSPLTPREHEVLRAARGGATIADLAGELYLSPGTVRNYLSAAMQKLGARSRAEAVRLAEEKGWL